MNELDLLTRAKHYMDCLSEKRNPIDGEPIEDFSVLDDEKIYKCFSFISGVLARQIMYNRTRTLRDGAGDGGAARRTHRVKLSLTPEQKATVAISEDPVGINTIAAHINDVIDQDKMRGVSGGKLAECLVKLGYLEIEETRDGGHIRVTTQAGKEAGIRTLERTDAVGRTYQQNVYNADMQRYLIDNIERIMSEEKASQEHSAYSSGGAGDRSGDAGDVEDAEYDDDIYSI